MEENQINNVNLNIFNPEKIEVPQVEEKLNERIFENKLERMLWKFGLNRNDLEDVIKTEWTDEILEDLKDTEFKIDKDGLNKLKIELQNMINRYKDTPDDEDEDVKKHPNDFFYDLYNGNFGDRIVDKYALTTEQRESLGVEFYHTTLNAPEMYEIVLIKEGNTPEENEYLPIFYDTTTKNESAYISAMVLKELKIKNWRAPLLTFHGQLIGVDPYDPYISEKTMGLIVNELQINNFYFFRELYRTPGNNDGEYNYFIFNIASVCMIWLMGQSYNIYVELSRPVCTNRKYIIFSESTLYYLKYEKSYREKAH